MQATPVPLSQSPEKDVKVERKQEERGEERQYKRSEEERSCYTVYLYELVRELKNNLKGLERWLGS